MTYIYIDTFVYYNNKKLINKFINEQDETKITFNKYPDKIGCVEIYMEISNHFECFIEYIFRKLGKNIIVCVGTRCDNFEKLKKMNVIIPEIYEKMLEEEYRRGVKV